MLSFLKPWIPQSMNHSALVPKSYFNAEPKPAYKRPIRPSDSDRLFSLYEKIIAFNNLSFEMQIFDLKNHAIELGKMRRQVYETNPNLWDTDSE